MIRPPGRASKSAGTSPLVSGAPSGPVMAAGGSDSAAGSLPSGYAIGGSGASGGRRCTGQTRQAEDLSA